MSLSLNRRSFIAAAGAGLTALSAGLSPRLYAANTTTTLAQKELPFKISLAQWSLHKAIQGGKINNLEFAKIAKEKLGIDGVEYVNQFFKDKAKDEAYLGEMKKIAADHGVTSVLIMVDGEGALGDKDEKKRMQTVENHKKWVDAAKFLGCHAIRVNAGSSGSYGEQMMLAADGLRKLSEYGDTMGINVIVENHGGLSSNGAWLYSVMRIVDHPRCGTLPDFGNFVVDSKTVYDHYLGLRELMPFAKAISVKTYDFKDNAPYSTFRGDREFDLKKMMGIVSEFKYTGYCGIEYEGGKLEEMDGIAKTKEILVKIRDEA
ncbi:sugar phosphate isomerase/epimerase family protein [Lacunimicrobium album]